MKKKNIIEQRKFTIPSVISVYMNQVYMIFVLLDNEELALRAVLLPKAYKSLDPTDEARTWICKKKRHGIWFICSDVPCFGLIAAEVNSEI